MRLPSPLLSLRPNKTWLLLGIALGVGLLAALAARSYLGSRLAEIEARGKGETVSLIVAKRELRKGEQISEDTVAVRPIPVDYVHSQAIPPDGFERIEGQALAFPVKSGEMILWSLLEGKRAPTFSSRVAAGRRAITVPVDEINSISGLLEPGDAIDLISTIEKKDHKHTFALLQNVTVLATGQRSVDDPKSGERRLYSTVTLDTTPAEAQSIIRAREAGKLTALLRNPQDHMPVATADPRPVDAEAGEVPVLYGGRSGPLPREALHLGRRPRAGMSDGPPAQPESGLAVPAPLQSPAPVPVPVVQTARQPG